MIGLGVGLLLLVPVHSLAEPLVLADEAGEIIKQYHACIIKNIKPAQSGVAAKYLQSACQYKFPSEKMAYMAKNNANRAGVYDLQKTDELEYGLFYDCLLKYLPAVKNDHSAKAMYQLCKEQFYPVTELSPQDNKPNKILQFLGLGKKPSQADSSHWTIDGDYFAPLQPWQGGKK